MKVLNKYKDKIPEDSVYIGRGSLWGNPYPMIKKEDRSYVVEEYQKYLDEQISKETILPEEIRYLDGRDLVCFCAPLPCHGDILLNKVNKYKEQMPTEKRRFFIWKRYDQNGYEVSTSGDARFSALRAKLKDDRTIEMHYQCDIKGFDVGGTNISLGKGKPPKDLSTNLWKSYLSLWEEWSRDNMELMKELKHNASLRNHTLTDQYAKTHISQARALAFILNRDF